MVPPSTTSPKTKCPPLAGGLSYVKLPQRNSGAPSRSQKIWRGFSKKLALWMLEYGRKSIEELTKGKRKYYAEAWFISGRRPEKEEE